MTDTYERSARQRRAAMDTTQQLRAFANFLGVAGWCHALFLWGRVCETLGK